MSPHPLGCMAGRAVVTSLMIHGDRNEIITMVSLRQGLAGGRGGAARRGQITSLVHLTPDAARPWGGPGTTRPTWAGNGRPRLTEVCLMKGPERRVAAAPL